jgi:hypothetical protein
MYKDWSPGSAAMCKDRCLEVWNEEGVAQAVIEFLYDFGFSIGFYNVGMITTAPKIAITKRLKRKALSDIIFTLLF